MTSAILEVSHLTKHYGSFRAVDDISFSIKEGEIVGLLGPNGAGKTTTTQMLLGLTEPTGGTISYFGTDLSRHRSDILKKINYVSAFAGMQTRVTARENLEVFAGIYEIKNWHKKVGDLAERLGIAHKLDTLYWFLSSGEKARVNLVKAFLNDPVLILMDEPTASLDPEIVSVVLDLIYEMRKHNDVAILYTSHNMGEVTRICDRVMFLSHGKIIATDTPLGLSRRVGSATLILTFDDEKERVVSYLKRKRYSYTLPHTHVMEIAVHERNIPKVLFGFAKEKIWITDIEIKKPDLEDVFLAVARGGDHALDAN